MTALETLHYGPQVRVNARTWGRNFQSRFIEPGVISYKDIGGDIEYLSKETLDRFASTFVGRPVIIRHSKVTPETMEGKACGYISRVWYDPNDGWFWCEGVITNDEAKGLVESGWSVSCGYRVQGTDETGGVYHCIPYRRELTAFEGEHLALVENPRYEGATIRLNSKPTTNMTNLFKLFRKKAAAPAASAPKTEDKPGAAATPPEARENEKPEQPTLSADSVIEVAPGKTAKLGEIIERFNAAPAETEELSPESTIEVKPGKTVTIAELVARYNEASEFKHPEVKRNENESEEDYKNRCHAYDEEKARKENAKKEEAQKGQFFRVLAAAKETPTAPVIRANSTNSEDERLARGRERYGSGHGKN